MVLETMSIPDSCKELARNLANGRPGRVSCLVDADIGHAIAEWWDMSADMAAADIGEVEAWISRNVSRVPHSLITDAILHQLAHSLIDTEGGFALLDELHEVARKIAMWPESVRRHTLRPAQSLLAHVVGLRLALRQVNKAA